MDRRERFEDLNEALLAAFQGHQATVWTALPAIVQSFNPTAMTCVVRPAIQARVLSKDDSPPLPGAVFDKNNWWWVELPQIFDVPVVFSGGGGLTLTFPISAGDEALVIFASRCIDAWWQSGGVQVQAELRMHDLSDGFAIVGIRSKPRVLAGISVTKAQLRTDDGSTFIEIGAGVINITGNVNITGAVVATGEGTFNGGHTVSAHVHGASGPPSG